VRTELGRFTRWLGRKRWLRTHPKAWIRDPEDNIRYEAPHYWDRDNSGSYEHRYAAKVRDARRAGY